MNRQIIVAMDNEIEDGIRLISKTRKSPEIYGYKIGSLWILNRGVDILRTVSNMLGEVNSNQQIILDMQKWGTDIPDIITKQINYVSPLINEAIVCPMGGGRQSLKAFADACRENTIEPICVLEMTHPDSNSYLHGRAHMDILHDALSFNIKKFVIPATKKPSCEIKESLAFRYGDYVDNIMFYATGFKAQGGQTKPMIDFGVTNFIMGRAIYESPDPIKTVHDVYEEINTS